MNNSTIRTTKTETPLEKENERQDMLDEQKRRSDYEYALSRYDGDYTNLKNLEKYMKFYDHEFDIDSVVDYL